MDDKDIARARLVSYAGATVGVLACVVAFVAWALTGRTSHLVAAVAFAALVPAWYLRPIYVDQSTREALRERATPLPRLVRWLSVAGFILLGVSIALRIAS
jgi:hypothetical protein